jgi:hypothetical protein
VMVHRVLIVLHRNILGVGQQAYTEEFGFVLYCSWEGPLVNHILFFGAFYLSKFTAYGLFSASSVSTPLIFAHLLVFDSTIGSFSPKPPTSSKYCQIKTFQNVGPSFPAELQLALALPGFRMIAIFILIQIMTCNQSVFFLRWIFGLLFVQNSRNHILRQHM